MVAVRLSPHNSNGIESSPLCCVPYVNGTVREESATKENDNEVLSGPVPHMSASLSAALDPAAHWSSAEGFCVC